MLETLEAQKRAMKGAKDLEEEKAEKEVREKDAWEKREGIVKVIEVGDAAVAVS